MKTTHLKQRFQGLLALSCLGVLLFLPRSAEATGEVTTDILNVNQTATVHRAFTVILQDGSATNGGGGGNGLLYYSCNTSNAATVADESGNSHDGTVSGAIWTGNGLVGAGAYDFNGTNSYIEASGDDLNITNFLTMAAWVNFKGEGSGNHFVLMKHRNSGLQYGMARYNSGYGGNAHKFVAILGNNGSHDDFASSYTLNDDTTYFLCSTYDGTNVTLYVNGTNVGSSSRSGPIDGDTAGTLDIGREHTWSEYANATIDEPRVYDRALSAAEVMNLFTNAPGGVASSTNVLLRASGTNITLSGQTFIKELIPQGDVSMGSFTSRP